MKYIRSNKNIPSLQLPCKKTVFHTKEDANEMIKDITLHRITKSIKPYKCPVCGFWHLTSKTL
jgi:hypothetical protein